MHFLPLGPRVPLEIESKSLSEQHFLKSACQVEPSHESSHFPKTLFPPSGGCAASIGTNRQNEAFGGAVNPCQRSEGTGLQKREMMSTELSEGEGGFLLLAVTDRFIIFSQ